MSKYGSINFEEKKIADEAVWKEMKKGFDTEIQALNMHVLELQRSKEEVYFSFNVLSFPFGIFYSFIKYY